MTSKYRRFLFVCLVAALCWLPANAGDGPDPHQLLQEAHQVSNLAALMPYVLTANLVINPSMGNEKKGHIRIFRDQDKSRSELKVEDYLEVKVTVGNKLYVSRSTPAPAPGYSRFHDLDRIWDKMSESGDAKLSDVSKKKVQNIQAECFEVKGEQKHRLCFDPSRKVLLEDLTQSRAMEFTDYASVEQQLIPRKITVLLELETSERPILTVDDLEIKKEAMPEGAFNPPQQAQEFDTCENLQPAKPLKTPNPEFSNAIRRNNMGQPGVNVYGIVDKEGNLENVKVLTADAEVRTTVLEALKKWHYTPAMCGTTPVASEKEILVPFFEFGSMSTAPSRR